MEHHQKPIKQNLIYHSCPYLSLKYDPATYAAFPSEYNACYRCQYPQTPKISHQRAFCLSPHYIDCPILSNNNNDKLPEEIKFKSKNQYPKIVIGIIAFLIVMVIGYMGVEESKASGGIIGMSSQTKAMSHTESPTKIPRVTNIAAVDTISPTFQPSSTSSPKTMTPTKPDPVLALETPIGGQYQFIIHRVLEGESLQYFADRYDSSREAITAVNENLIMPLWVGSIVIIPLNITETTDIPTFLAYQIEEEGITVTAVAEKYSVQKEKLAFYNDIDPEHILHQGEWLLIPQE